MSDAVIIRDGAAVPVLLGGAPGTTGAEGPTGPAGDVAKVADRTALSLVAGSAGMARMLVEGGRAGLFVFDSSDLSAMVTADPAQGVYVAPAGGPSGAGGAWVRQHGGKIKPQHFGGTPSQVMPDALTVTATDNLAALNAIEAFQYAVNPNRQRLEVDFSDGTWGLSDTFTIRTHYYRSHRIIGGRFQYVGSAPLDTLIQVNGSLNARLSGEWVLYGLQSTGDAAFASRKVDRGMVLKNMSRGKVGTVWGSNFRRHLVDWDDDGSSLTNNMIGATIEAVITSACGMVGRGANNISSAFTATHNAPGAVLDQRSTLTLDAAFVAAHRVYDTISFKGRVYLIRAIPSATTMEVFPWIVDPVTPTAKANAGTVWGGAGGGLRVRHNDQAGVKIGLLESVNSGHPIHHAGQYGVTVDVLIAESCNAAYEVGKGADDISRGLRIGVYHSEGTSSQSETVGGVNYMAGFEGISKSQLRCEVIIDQISAIGGDNDSSILRGFRQICAETLDPIDQNHVESPYGLQVNFGGETYRSNGYMPRTGARLFGSGREVSNAPDRRKYVIHANSFAWTTFYDEAADKALGECHWFEVEVIGTGTNGAPTGTVSVGLGPSDAAAGFQLNAATATVNFTSAAGSIRLVGFFDPAVSTAGGWKVANVNAAAAAAGGSVLAESNGAPLTIDSLNSNFLKAVLKDAGTVVGYIGAGSGDAVTLNKADGSVALGVNSSGNVRVDTGSFHVVANDIYCRGDKVVGAQGAAVADATGAGDVVAQLNTLLARLRAHGLIA